VQLRLKSRTLDLSAPVIMGVLNVTPDSFSDGGRFAATDAALAHARGLVADGARIVDVGGESTRPGAQPVPEAQELERVVPVIERIRAELDCAISIDTAKPGVMRAACAAGAELINDVMALRAPGALEAARDAGAAVCLMHMQGEPRTMQQAPAYLDVVEEVAAFLRERAEACLAAGIPSERLVVDPGFGFGKTLQHNLELLRDRRDRGARPAGARRRVAQVDVRAAAGPRRRRARGRRPRRGGDRRLAGRAHRPHP
jgi:dihydropteroate synthase